MEKGGDHIALASQTAPLLSKEGLGLPAGEQG